MKKATANAALKLALEALELVSIEFVCNGAHHAKKDRHDWSEPCPIVERYQAAITAIKEALAQPEQEPVAWEQFYPDIGKPQLGQEPVAIYRAGQAKGEGFHVEFLKEMGDDEVLLYTTPPKRPWVGLTEVEKQQMYQGTMWGTSIYGYADAVEAKLKELNT